MNTLFAKNIEICLADSICRTIRQSKGFRLYIQKMVGKDKRIAKWKGKTYTISEVSTLRFEQTPYVWVYFR